MPVCFSNFDTYVRNISVSQMDGYVAVTLGPGSYLVQANLEYGNPRGHVLVGRYSSLAHRLLFKIGLNHDYHEVSTYPFMEIRPHKSSEDINHKVDFNHYQVIIGNDVWIGCDVTIMGGVRIGNGAVIGAGAVVAKDIPPYAIAVGNPVRVIKYRFTEEIIQKLQRIKWWNWSPEKIQENLPLMKDVPAFVDRFYQEPVPAEEVDETVKGLRALKAEGTYIYYFIPDFTVEKPVWYEVLEQYLECYTAADSVALLLGMDDSGKYAEQLEKVRKRIQDKGDQAPLVLTFQGDVLSEGVLQVMDTFITSREDISSWCIDYLDGTDKNIVYGLEYHIFKK